MLIIQFSNPISHLDLIYVWHKAAQSLRIFVKDIPLKVLLLTKAQ